VRHVAGELVGAVDASHPGGHLALATVEARPADEQDDGAVVAEGADLEEVVRQSQELASIEPYLPKLVLEPQLTEFLQACEIEAERQKKVEEERHRHELRLVEEKLAAQRRATQRQRIYLGITMIFLIASVWLGIWGWKSNMKAKRTLAELQREQIGKVFRSIDDIEFRDISLRQKYKQVSDSLLWDANRLLVGFPEKEALIDSLRKQLELKRVKIDSLSRLPY
jgi:hypothetical protein